MKKSILAAAAVALLASTGAKAADVVTYQEQPVTPAPVQSSDVNWNGVYVGGSIGGSWANSKTTLRGTNSVTRNDDGSLSTTYGRLARKNADPDSFIGGLYAGYNFQPTFLSDSALRDIVLGVETDWMWNSSGGNGKKGFEVFGYNNGNTIVNDGLYHGTVRQNWNGATRVRIGYAFGPEKRILPYFAAGVSYSDIRAKSQVSINDQGLSDRHSTKSRAGWNVGGGVDYIPPFLNDHIVLRAEYRFTDFGSGSFNKYNEGMNNQGIPVDAAFVGKQSVKFNQNDFRVGVAYKF